MSAFRKYIYNRYKPCETCNKNTSINTLTRIIYLFNEIVLIILRHLVCTNNINAYIFKLINFEYYFYQYNGTEKKRLFMEYENEMYKDKYLNT